LDPFQPLEPGDHLLYLHPTIHLHLTNPQRCSVEHATIVSTPRNLLPKPTCQAVELGVEAVEVVELAAHQATRQDLHPSLWRARLSDYKVYSS